MMHWCGSLSHLAMPNQNVVRTKTRHLFIINFRTDYVAVCVIYINEACRPAGTMVLGNQRYSLDCALRCLWWVFMTLGPTIHKDAVSLLIPVCSIWKLSNDMADPWRRWFGFTAATAADASAEKELSRQLLLSIGGAATAQVESCCRSKELAESVQNLSKENIMDGALDPRRR
jgi:hypothetical protein